MFEPFTNNFILKQQHWAGDSTQGPLSFKAFARYVHIGSAYITCIEVRPRPARSLSWCIIADSVDLGSLYILLQMLSLMVLHLLTSDSVIRPRGIEYAMQLPMNNVKCLSFLSG